MAFKVSIADKDRGMKALLARMKAANEKYLSVGIFGAKAAQVEPERRGRLPNATVGEVAGFMELYPAPNVPPRPFIGPTYEKNKTKYEDMVAEIGHGAIRGTRRVQEYIASIGQHMVDDIREEIDHGIPPPNAESTVAEKGSDTPLVDTGTLKDAIDWRITKTRPK